MIADLSQIQPRRVDFGQLERAISLVGSRQDFINTNGADVTEQLLKVYREHACSILSLDVFDTFLLRNNKAEALRYFEVSQRASELCMDKYAPEDFYLARYFGMETSYRVRREVDTCREGSFDEVLRNMAAQLRLDAAIIEQLKQIEIDYEVENLTVNSALVDLAREVKREGGKVILLSDMYLDAPTIRSIAERVVGDITFVDHIFSSADTVVSKRSGRVFKLIEAEMKATSGDYLHIGDNRVSDVVRPALAGWHSIHFPTSEHEDQQRLRSLADVKARLRKAGLDVSRWAKV